MHVGQLVDLGHRRQLLLDDGGQVLVEHVLLFVRQVLEPRERPVQRLRREAEPQRLEPLGEGMAARELAQDQLAFTQPDHLRPHDLVGLVVLQDPVLVDAGLMREGIVPDDRLVGLDHDAGQRAHQTGDLGDLRRVHARLRLVEVPADLQRHHDLFQRGVARALPDAVHGAFDLVRPVRDRRQRVGHRQPQVVVAVDADARPVDGLHVMLDGGDQPPELIRDGEPDRVRDVDRRGTRRNHRLQHLEQELRLRARRVFRRELDVAGIFLRILHRPHRLSQDLILGFAQLVFHVDRRGRQEHVDPLLRRRLKRLGGRVDVGGQRTGQRADGGTLDGLRDLADRSCVAGRGDGEAPLDHVDAQTGQLPRDLELLVRLQAGAGALLPVPQRRVENDDPSWHFLTHSLTHLLTPLLHLLRYRVQ